MSRLKVLNGKSQDSFNLPDISTIDESPGRTIVAPCETDWPQNSEKISFTPSFIQLKRSHGNFQKPTVDLWQRTCTAMGDSSSH